MTRHDALKRTVLVPLDGSVASATALPTARAIAALLKAGVEALHVAEKAEALPAFAKTFRVSAEELRGVGLRLEVGDAAETILQTTVDPSVVLMILTTHGRGRREPSGLSKVVETIAGRSEKPVLLLRPCTEGTRAAPVPLGRFLFPLDGDPATTGALWPALSLARELGALVDVLHVIPEQPPDVRRRRHWGPGFYADQPHHEWSFQTGRLAERLGLEWSREPQRAGARFFAFQGGLAETVVRCCFEWEADVCVVVRRSGLEPNRAPLIRALLADTRLPLLLLPGPHRGAQSPVAAA